MTDDERHAEAAKMSELSVRLIALAGKAFPGDGEDRTMALVAAAVTSAFDAGITGDQFWDMAMVAVRAARTASPIGTCDS